jgi:hypothetical protein
LNATGAGLTSSPPGAGFGRRGELVEAPPDRAIAVIRSATGAVDGWRRSDSANVAGSTPLSLAS